jgi:hypothetical protein
MLVAGCHTPTMKKPASRPTTGPSSLVMTITPMGPAGSRDPQPAPNAMVRLAVFMLDMPPGSVSNNPEFWKHVDEQAVGAANADRLLRNGIRCGTVPQSESAFFSRFFDQQPHKLSASHVEGMHTETFPLQMDKQFDKQDLFFFNATNELEGRSYDRGTNRLMLTFGPTPRDPGAVRLVLCPVVKTEKTRMDFTSLNQEYQSSAVEVERLYDLGLAADVPMSSFFIIAPSSDAQRRTSIGGCFLTKLDETEKKEQVILIVPTLLRMDGKPTRVRDEIVK